MIMVVGVMAAQLTRGGKMVGIVAMSTHVPYVGTGKSPALNPPPLSSKIVDPGLNFPRGQSEICTKAKAAVI